MKNRMKYSISRLVISVLATVLLAVMPAVAFAQGTQGAQGVTNPQLAKRFGTSC